MPSAYTHMDNSFASQMDSPLLKTGFLKQAPLTPEAEERFQIARNKVVEEVDIGDYELYLVLDRNFGFYQMGMQRVGQDFTDMEQQTDRTVPKMWGKFDRKAFKATIQRWLDKYHLLLVASHNNAKTKLYAMALRALGFRTQKTPSGGIVYLADGQADLGPVQKAEAFMVEALRRQREREQERENEGDEDEGYREASVRTATTQLGLRPDFVSRDFLLVASPRLPSRDRALYVMSSLLKMAGDSGIKSVAIRTPHSGVAKALGFRKETISSDSSVSEDYWIKKVG